MASWCTAMQLFSGAHGGTSYKWLRSEVWWTPRGSPAFPSSRPSRCVVLSDPLKDSSRSQESWSSFLLKLRTLLLMSFTKNLGRFEDDMRTLREKRTQPGWSFCEYFMVQVRGIAAGAFDQSLKSLSKKKKELTSVYHSVSGKGLRLINIFKVG